MADKKPVVPDPGTVEAIKLGCMCPEIDNHFGKGFMIQGKIHFWFNASCKVHVDRILGERDVAKKVRDI